MNIKKLVDRIVSDGKLTKEESSTLSEAIKADGKINPEEEDQIQRILEMITEGKLEVVL